MMSLYGKYINEREGREIVENEYGFITYIINEENCFIHDAFVLPEYRRNGAAKLLMNEIIKKARENGCKFLVAGVCPSTFGSNEALKIQLNYGFKLSSSTNNYIILKKSLEE